jgi:hypothetical protein
MEDTFDILLKFFNETESETVRHLVNVIKEGVDHIIFNIKTVKF